MSLLVESVIESSAILMVALLLVALLRRHSAALRHWVLTVAVGCAALAPIVGLVAPRWELPGVARLEREAVATLSPATPSAVATPSVPRKSAGAAQSRVASSPPSAGRLLVVVWALGTIAGLTLLAGGLLRLAYLSGRSRVIASGIWRERADALAEAWPRSRAITLRAAPQSSLLVTWGAMRPQIVVPAASLDWPAARIDVVLAHELAHVRRRDWVVQVAAEFVKCVFWFNPLVWIVCARLRRESEQACDDAVLRCGVQGPSYAEHLVEIARELKRSAEWVPAVAMARPSSLERRVRAMLDERINRRPLSSRAAGAACAALLAVTVPLAGSAAQTFATVTGTVSDGTNSVVPGVTLVLTNVQTEAKYEVRSDASGRYEFQGIVPGDYQFETRLPGFMSLRGTLTLGGQTVQRDITLQIGSLQETITVAGSRTAPAAPAAPLAAPRPKRPLPACASAPAAAPREGVVRVGGNVRPPHKLRDVRPVYPVSMSSQGIEGTVQLDARIGTDGLVEDVRVVSAPHPELGAAAADAVRDWVFDETLLNCVPVSVQMKVTVNFTVR